MTARKPIVRRTGLLALALAIALSGSSRAEFRYATTFGSAGTGDGTFTEPFGIASDGERTIYVSDVGGGAHRVQRFDTGNRAFLGAFPVPGTGSAPLFVAGHIAADPGGSVYVSDRSDARIDRFTADGHPLPGWGTRGDGDGQFRDPAGVATDSRGYVYVVDRQANRVQRFTPDGAFDPAWGRAGMGAGQFVAAEDVAVDVFGDVYVVDSGADRVQKFTADGVVLPESWGSTGAGEGQFHRPLGIATDGSGTVFVADTGNQRVQAFTSSGGFKSQFGGPGSGDGQFVNPVDVASDASGAVYVVDRGNARVQKFVEPAGPDTVDPPEAGKTANIALVSGVVLYRRPGASSFVPLKGDREIQIPMGALVQTKDGTVRLTTASDLGRGQQSAIFYDGLFKIRQRREASPVTELDLAGGNFAVCSKSAPRAARASSSRGAGGGLGVRAAAKRTSRRSKKVVRRLEGDGRGRFRTNGRQSAATVRGTRWLTEDRCDGTLTRVLRGRVEVRDFARRRTVIVTAGKSYLARRP